MSDRNRREIYSLIRFIKDKETEICNTLGFDRRTNNLAKSEKDGVNHDLKELCSQVKKAENLLDEYIEDLDSDSD